MSDEIDGQKNLLKIHTTILAQLVRQAGKMKMNTPQHVIWEIKDRQEEVRKIRRWLHGKGIPTQDDPNYTVEITYATMEASTSEYPTLTLLLKKIDHIEQQLTELTNIADRVKEISNQLEKITKMR